MQNVRLTFHIAAGEMIDVRLFSVTVRLLFVVVRKIAVEARVFLNEVWREIVEVCVMLV